MTLGEYIVVKFDKLSQFQLDSNYTGVIAVGLVHDHPDFKESTIANYDSENRTPFNIEQQANVEYHLSLIHEDKLKAHVAYVHMDDQKTIYIRFNLKNSDLRSRLL